jgi:hypothetical protein
MATLHPLYLYTPIATGIKPIPSGSQKITGVPTFGAPYDNQANDESPGMFLPTIATNQEITNDIIKTEKESKSINLSKVSEDYLVSVANRDKTTAYDKLGILFKYKSDLVKTILETAILLVGELDVKTVNTCFQKVTPNMSPEDAVLITKLLIQIHKLGSRSSYIEKARNISLPPTIELKDIISFSGVDESYIKLEYCSRNYWLFPVYLIILDKKKINKSLTSVKDLPDLEAVDTKIAREISEKSY